MILPKIQMIGLEKNGNGGSGSGILMTILTKHGPWAFFACCFLAIVVFYLLKPAALAQDALREDRVKLINATTQTLEMNAESMQKMASAIEALSATMKTIEKTEVKTGDLLEGFTKEVKNCHDEQNKKLDGISDKLEGGAP